jgi:hypothetical protein
MIRCDYSRSRHAQTEESKKIEKKIDNRSVWVRRSVAGVGRDVTEVNDLDPGRRRKGSAARIEWLNDWMIEWLIENLFDWVRRWKWKIWIALMRRSGQCSTKSKSKIKGRCREFSSFMIYFYICLFSHIYIFYPNMHFRCIWKYVKYKLIEPNN